MFSFLTALHVIVCIALILIVLLQTGKGAEMGAAFGGSTQTVFGSSGPAGFLNKITTGVAVLFMITSLGLCYMSGRLPIPTIMDEKVADPAKVEQPLLPPVEDTLPSPQEEAVPVSPQSETLPIPQAEQAGGQPESIPAQ